jgi:hypothetical protein
LNSVLAAASTPPAKCVLGLLAGLLHVALHLIDPALDLEAPVSGDLASVPLDEVIAASSADVEAGPFRHDSIG